MASEEEGPGEGAGPEVGAGKRGQGFGRGRGLGQGRGCGCPITLGRSQGVTPCAMRTRPVTMTRPMAPSLAAAQASCRRVAPTTLAQFSPVSSTGGGQYRPVWPSTISQHSPKPP